MRRRIVLCCLLAVFVGLTTTDSAQAFPDVPPDRLDYAAITGLTTKGAVLGFSDGTFRPDMPISRGQFVKMVAAAVFLPLRESDRTPFSDVGNTTTGPSYPDSYVAAAYVAGIVEGQGEGVFDPYAPLTRAQAMTIVVRAAQKLKRAGSQTSTDRGTRVGSRVSMTPIHGENATTGRGQSPPRRDRPARLGSRGPPATRSEAAT